MRLSVERLDMSAKERLMVNEKANEKSNEKVGDKAKAEASAEEKNLTVHATENFLDGARFFKKNATVEVTESEFKRNETRLAEGETEMPSHVPAGTSSRNQQDLETKAAGVADKVAAQKKADSGDAKKSAKSDKTDKGAK